MAFRGSGKLELGESGESPGLCIREIGEGRGLRLSKDFGGLNFGEGDLGGEGGDGDSSVCHSRSRRFML